MAMTVCMGSAKPSTAVVAALSASEWPDQHSRHRDFSVV